MLYIFLITLLSSVSSIFAADIDAQPTISKINVILSWPHHGDPYSKPCYGYGYENSTTKLYTYVRGIKEGNDEDYFACIPSEPGKNNKIEWTGKEAQKKYNQLAQQYNEQQKALTRQRQAVKQAELKK